MPGYEAPRRTGKPIRFEVRTRHAKKVSKSITGRMWDWAFKPGRPKNGRFWLALFGTPFTGVADAVRVGIETAHRHGTWHSFKAGMTKEQKEQCNRLKRAWEIQIDREERLMDLKEKVFYCYIDYHVRHHKYDNKFFALRTKLVQMYPNIFNNNDDSMAIYDKMDELFWSTRYIEGKLYQALKAAYHHWQDTKEYKFENEIKDPYGCSIYKDGEGIQANYLQRVKNLGAYQIYQTYVTNFNSRNPGLWEKGYFMQELSYNLDMALKTKTTEQQPVQISQVVPTSAPTTNPSPTPTTAFVTPRQNKNPQNAVVLPQNNKNNKNNKNKPPAFQQKNIL